MVHAIINDTPNADWIVIGDWMAYRYSQFVDILGFLLLGWWVNKVCIVA